MSEYQKKLAAALNHATESINPIENSTVFNEESLENTIKDHSTLVTALEDTSIGQTILDKAVHVLNATAKDLSELSTKQKTAHEDGKPEEAELTEEEKTKVDDVVEKAAVAVESIALLPNVTHYPIDSVITNAMEHMQQGSSSVIASVANEAIVLNLEGIKEGFKKVIDKLRDLVAALANKLKMLFQQTILKFKSFDGKKLMKKLDNTTDKLKDKADLNLKDVPAIHYYGTKTSNLPEDTLANILIFAESIYNTMKTTPKKFAAIKDENGAEEELNEVSEENNKSLMSGFQSTFTGVLKGTSGMSQYLDKKVLKDIGDDSAGVDLKNGKMLVLGRLSSTDNYKLSVISFSSDYIKKLKDVTVELPKASAIADNISWVESTTDTMSKYSNKPKELKDFVNSSLNDLDKGDIGAGAQSKIISSLRGATAMTNKITSVMLSTLGYYNTMCKYSVDKYVSLHEARQNIV